MPPTSAMEETRRSKLASSVTTPRGFSGLGSIKSTGINFTSFVNSRVSINPPLLPRENHDPFAFSGTAPSSTPSDIGDWVFNMVDQPEVFLGREHCIHHRSGIDLSVLTPNFADH